MTTERNMERFNTFSLILPNRDVQKVLHSVIKGTREERLGVEEDVKDMDLAT